MSFRTEYRRRYRPPARRERQGLGGAERRAVRSGLPAGKRGRFGNFAAGQTAGSRLGHHRIQQNRRCASRAFSFRCR